MINLTDDIRYNIIVRSRAKVCNHTSFAVEDRVKVIRAQARLRVWSQVGYYIRYKLDKWDMSND